MKSRLWSFVCALVLLAGPVHADVWDTATDTDDNTGTDNTPIHGTIQVHDLGVRPGPVADADFYSISADPRTSWEAIIDGLTGDTGGSLSFQWLAADGTTVLVNGQSLSSASCTLCTQSARFNNDAATATPVFIRVGNPGCTTTCNSLDQYTFRLRETTYSIPRFNNSATQVTILLLQNTAAYTVNASVHFWNTAGAYLGAQLHILAAHSLHVVNTSALGFAAGIGGSITVSNDGRYGDLSGKAVAVEAATGFSFDTPMLPKP